MDNLDTEDRLVLVFIEHEEHELASSLNMLREEFVSAANGMGRDGSRLWSLAEQAYSARLYHNLRHLAALRLNLLPHRHHLDWTQTVLAIVYHDLWLEPLCRSNERNSAKLLNFDFDPRDVKAAHEMILATERLNPPRDRQCALFVDADMAVLSSEPSEYSDYASNVMGEYAPSVGLSTYVRKRLEFLSSTIDRGRYGSSIYHTTEFMEYETAAMFNMGQEHAYLYSVYAQ